MATKTSSSKNYQDENIEDDDLDFSGNSDNYSEDDGQNYFRNEKQELSKSDVVDIRKLITNTLKFLKNFNEPFRKFLEEANGGKTLNSGKDDQITVLDADVLMMIIFDKFGDQKVFTDSELKVLEKALRKAISLYNNFRSNEPG